MEKDKGLFSFRKHPVGELLDGKKGRRRKGGRLRRSMGFLLAAALVFNTLPASGFAVSASEQEKGLCEHHPEHTPECGYAEAQPCTHEHGEECYKTVTECVHTHTDECYPEVEETEESTGEGSATTSDAGNREPSLCTHVCSEESGCITKVLDCHHEHDENCGYQEAQDCGYVCEICNGTEPENTENNAENDAENADTDTAECICETLCTEDSINGNCPVCGAEDADLSRCKGEKTEEQEKTGEKVITAWEWIDSEEYLTDGMLALPGAGRENPAFAEDVTALLPEKIQAKVAAVTAAEDGEETEEDAETAPETEDAEITLTGWECASYPKDGAYEGTYTFTASLPEGFVLAEDAAALEVKVELGGVEMLAETVSVSYQEASWNGSEVTYTGKTETCTPVESSADAVTWNAGWYVVNSTATITEPITVTGEVNLILADGCALNAEKGIVVPSDASLTIYAQTGGTGTLNATGTADSDNASAGIGGSTSSLDSGTITIHGGEIKATGGVVNDNFGAPNYGGAGIGGGSPRSGNGGSSGAITIYGGTITANSGTGNLTGAGIGGGGGNNGGTGSNITIYGGNVTAEAHSTSLSGSGAGIGGGFGSKGGGAGSVTIFGGTVHATGGYYGAGIGGGGSGAGQNPDSSLYQSGSGTGITISGGIVTAVGGQFAAGIGGGGGYYSSYTVGNTTYGSGCTGGTGSVTISGGIVDAKGGAGNSSGNYAGDPIGNGGNTTATATVEETNAIVFENGAGTVCGDVTLDGSYTVPGDYTLNIPAGASLSGSGTLSGGGTFTTENLTADMISVPTDLYYTGEDRSADITTRLSDELTTGVTICGQTFAVSGWTLAVEKTGDLIYTATYTNNNDNTNTFTKTITLLKSGTKFEGDVKTYNGDTQTTTFNADDTITVKATPTATGTAPQKAAARLRGGYTAPTAGQMALFVGDVQVSEPVQAGEGGTYTMTVSASEVLLQGNAEPNGNAITLTAKFVGNDNMADAAGTVDVRISAVAMAERDGEVIGYFGVSNFEGTNNLFFQNAYTNATITLLRDVQPGTNSDAGTTCSTMVNITCTLDLTGHKFTSTDTAIFVLPGGNLTIQDSSTGKTGNVSFIKSDGTLTLYGGTFGKIETAYTLSSLLAENCAYYRGSTPIPLSELEGQKTLDGTVTVQECDHTGVEVKDLGNGKHGLDCPYCGYHSEHTTTLTATASGNTVTLNGGCGTEGCGYQTTLGTASFTFPNVTYGQSGDVTCAWDGPTGYYGLIEVIGGSQSQFEKNADEDIAERSWTLAQLFGRTKVTAGKHKLKVSFFTDVWSNECELDFTIDPAPLTADMVTLGQTDVTYNRAEQKPILSVKHGETPLTEGTDYEVRYTRDGVVTNDFTNAGTVNITVTGKGNYEGEVEKTFTIKQAESDVGTVTAETLENTLDVSQVVLSRTNQTPAGTLTLTDSTLKYGTNTYTWKFMPDDTVNYKAATGTVQVTVNDTIAPSAEYQLGTDGWKKFVNTVTFGLFCKDFKTVDIRSTDDTDAVTGSGIASTQYYISDQEITDTDSIVWETYTKPISLDALGKYFIYVKVTDNAGNTAVLNSEGIVIYAESTVSPAVFDYTYKENRDCTVQLAMNGNTFKGFTDREGNAVGINDYTIDGDGRLILKAAYLDTLDQGEYAYTVSVNPQGIETDQVTLAYTFTVNVKARELTVTGAAAAGRAYDGTNKVEITAVTLDGIVGSDTVAVDVSGIQGTLSSANAGTYTSVTLPVLTLTGADSGNYILVQPQAAVPTSVTITPLSAVITVGTNTYHKTFGDAAFTLDVTDNNAEADVQYEVTKGTDVVSVENGTVTILNAGTAEIRVSLPASTNYNAAENKTITVTVAKASAPSVETELKQYIKTKGSGGEAAVVDVAGKLPADRGETTYTPVLSDDSKILSDVAVDQNGKLTYKVGAGEAGSTASIRVTAKMGNYTDAVFNLEIRLVEVIRAKIKAEAENAVYDGSPQKGYADGITCDYPVAGYAFAYKGREDNTYDSSEPPMDAGSYTVTVSVSDQSGDYEGSVSLAFIIEKASITIKADDKTAEKGSPVPELTYTASGLAEKDMLAAAPKLACDADMGTEGSYPITVSGAKAPDTKNYYEKITYENGMLTVQDSAVHVTGVSLDKSALSLSERGTGQLTAVLSPENATDKRVSWTSGNTAAASVDSSGKVTAVREGTAVITVTTADGGYTASCTVTVTKDRGSGSTGGGSGSTGGGSGSTGGGSGSTGGSTDTKQPFIKDSSGREGWDVIRAEAETAAAAPAGGTVAVDMNGAVSVPGSIFAAVCGKDVTLSFDMGSGVTWSVNGKDVTAEAAGDTDFSVTADAGAIPKELLAETAGGLVHLEISLAHEGAFGFTATLTLRITGRDGNSTAIGSSGAAAEYTGMYANLFYYNPDLRSLEFVCAGQVREDGTADLPFVHASDYTVILSAYPMGGTGTPDEPEKPQEPAAEAKVKSVKLSKTLYTYDGKLKKPAVLAVDTEGRRISARYYTVSYKNNRKAGKATATVKFKDGYSGTVKKTFTIRPAGTSIQKLTAVSGGFAIKWKKKTVQTGGYQIQYSANAGFQGNSTHSVFVKKNTAIKKTVKNLKAGKKYYVRIRTYQTVKEDGKNIRIYSAWSRAARVNTLPVSRKKTASSSRDRAFLMVEKEDGKKRAA